MVVVMAVNNGACSFLMQWFIVGALSTVCRSVFTSLLFYYFTSLSAIKEVPSFTPQEAFITVYD